MVDELDFGSYARHPPRSKQGDVIRKWSSNFQHQSHIFTILDVQDQKNLHSTMLYAYPLYSQFLEKKN